MPQPWDSLSPFVKDASSPDFEPLVGQSGWMQEVLGASEFDRLFRDRITRLRLQEQMTQKEVAKLLGIEEETYKKYETRASSKLPHYLIPRFAEIVGCDIAYLFTGQSAAPARLGPRRPRRVLADN